VHRRGTGLRLYGEVARLSFRRFSTYRGAMIAGAFTNTIFGFIRAGLLRSSLRDQVEGVAGLTMQSATMFVFLGQALIAVTMLFGDYSLIELVRSGDVATELHRPWDWSTYRLASDLGRSAFQLLSRALLITMAGWLVYRLPIPGGGDAFWFGLTVVLAAILASRIWTIAGLAAFWLTEAVGVMQMGVAVAMLGTGLLVPLQFLPERVADVLWLLPFAGLLQGPIDVLLDLRSPLPVIALQLFWIVALELVLRFELRAAVRKLELQGG
jgi:ABC-2 type transport system permease protein